MTALSRCSGYLPPNGSTKASRGQVTPMLALGQRTGERDDCLLMLWAPNIQVVAGEIQEHPLLG